MFAEGRPAFRQMIPDKRHKLGRVGVRRLSFISGVRLRPHPIYLRELFRASPFSLLRAHCFRRDLGEFGGPGFLCNDMDLRRRRLAPVLGLEVCDSLFDLSAPLRIFFAQLVRDPVDLKTFELAALIEFIAGAVTEFFHLTPEGRLIDFPGVAYRLDHVVGLEGVTSAFWRNGKIRGREMSVNMRIKRARGIMLKARRTKHTCRHALAVDPERSFFDTSKALQLCVSFTDRFSMGLE